MYRKAGFKVHTLKVIADLRDWNQAKAKYDEKYPKSPIFQKTIQLWPMEKAEAYIKERIKHHINYDREYCNKPDRWASDDKYAIMKKGRKSAVKLCNTQPEAMLYMESKKLDLKTHWIDLRKGENRRCEDYCDVNRFCEYYKNKQKGVE